MSDLAALVLDAIEADPTNLARLRALIGAPPAPEAAGPEWLTVAEAAEHLRCKPKRIYDLTGQHRIPYVKDGTRTLLRRTDLDAYLTNSHQEAHAA